MNERGFTLLELLSVILIIAILLSLALPSYREYSLRSHRSEGLQALIESALRVEKDRLVNRRYIALPPKLSRSGYYRIETRVDTEGSEFSLKAIPQGSQAADKCGTLGLDSLSRRTAGGDPERCWNGR